MKCIKRPRLACIISITLLPSVAHANIVWPALVAETKVSSLQIIALSLLIEYWFFKWLFQIDTKQAILYTMAANISSGILGLFLRPLSGIAYELSLGMIVYWLFNWGSFNPIAWFFVPITGGAINSVLELGTIRIIWKRKITKRNFYLTWMINAFTVAIATAWAVICPPRM